MALTYEQAFSRDQERDARAFVFEYYAVPGWECGPQTPEALQSWFERVVADDDTVSYIVAKDSNGTIVGAHVTTAKNTEGIDGIVHWRRVLTIVVAPGYNPLDMHWNLTTTFMATLPEGESWICNCDRLVYDAVKEQPTMEGAVATDIPDNPIGPNMVEVVGYHLATLPDLIDMA